ncbi:MAG TPA: hypothetical protein VJ952_06315 [Opitutales bacterium]|nr:hypothetical protein [Opitutales bacterium]
MGNARAPLTTALKACLNIRSSYPDIKNARQSNNYQIGGDNVIEHLGKNQNADTRNQ